ncbi:hypothetical protein [Streptomyces sp. 7N604]|uniref:hypothetical protein n=1 Tax=Streptomyces sp. 7N604 TaxID=3457415 RepID=UPI003FD66113
MTDDEHLPHGHRRGRDPQQKRRPQQRKQVLLRLDPAVHDAIARWAEAELRSTNAQIEFLLRRALADTGRLPKSARPPRRPAASRRRTRSATDDHELRCRLMSPSCANSRLPPAG